MPCRTAEALAEAPVVLVGTVEAKQLEHVYDGAVVKSGHRLVRVRVEEILRGEVEGHEVDLWGSAVYGERVLVMGEPAVVGGRTLTDVLSPGRWAVFSRGTAGELLGQLDAWFPLQCLGIDGWAPVQGDTDGLFRCPDTHRLGFDGLLEQVRVAAALLPPSATSIEAPGAGLVPDEPSPRGLPYSLSFEGLEEESLEPAVLVDPLPAQVDAPPPWVPRPASEAVPSKGARRAACELSARHSRYAEPGTYLSAKAAIEAAGSQTAAGATYLEAQEALLQERESWPFHELVRLRSAVEIYRRHAWAEGSHELADWLLERRLDLKSMTRDGPVDEQVLGVEACLLVDAAGRCEGCGEGQEVARQAKPYCR